MHTLRRSIHIPRSVKNSSAAVTFVHDFNASHLPNARPARNCSQTASQTEANTSSSNEKILPLKQLPGSGLLQSLYKFVVKDGFSRIHLLDQESRNKYGVMFRQNFGPFNAVYVCDPDLVQQVFQMEGKYPKREPALPQWEKYHKDRGKTNLGIFLAEGEQWYTSRSALNPKMLKTKEVSDYIPMLHGIADELVSRLREAKTTTSDHSVPNIHSELFKWSLESIGTVMLEKRFGLFDNPPSKEAQLFIDSVHTLLKEVLNIMFYPPWLNDYYKTKSVRNFYGAFDALYDFAGQAVQEKLQKLQQENVKYQDGDKVDFLTFLIENKKLPKETILTNFAEILFAAVDTTSTTTLFTLYNLARNPDKQERLHEELVSVLNPGHSVTPSTINKMHYLRACIKETMRLYPAAVANSRLFDTDITLQGYNIPKGTMVVFPLYTMGRDPKIFDDPLQFKPERWLRDGASNQYHPFASLPFGYGVRKCIGHRIAMLEMNLLLSKIIHEFHVESLNEIGTKTRGLLMPDKDILLKLNERKS